MTKARAELTELEGAILGVLRRAPGMTPYAVRKVFLSSQSEEWSGSAGAVYPAIARMEARRLIAARAGGDARGTRAYSLTAAGRRAHDGWLCDDARAAGIGIDPFRTRAGLWALLPAPRRRAVLRALEQRLRRQRETLIARPGDDAAIDRLLLALCDARLAWLKSAA